MKNFKKQLVITAKSIGFIAIALTAGATLSYAGSLTPSAVPSATLYTLGDIYSKLTTGATTTESNHSLSTSTSPASSFYTLTEIYNAVPATLSLSASTTTVPVGINTATTTLNTIDTDLTATNIKSGATIFGVAGSYTGPTLTWSADAHTGTDASIFTDQTACVAWGATWGGSSCSGLSDQSVGTMCWDGNQGCSEGPNTGVIAGHGAVEYCQYLDNSGNLSGTVQNIWRLPTYTELVDASPSGDHITSGFQSDGYWSATSYPFGSSYAWHVAMYDGYSGHVDSKNNPFYLARCVR